jgi:surface antigen
MRKSALMIVVALSSSLLLNACATKEESGALTGAVIGGVVGSTAGRGHKNRNLATFLGIVAGAMIGSRIGRYMDEQDRMRTQMALEKNPTRQPSSWVNPDTGNRYTVTPTRTFETAQGPCREFTMDAVIGGRTEQVYGTACRQPDGSWKVVK